MVFSVEYKQKIYNLLSNNECIGTLMRALEDNDDVSVRFILEFLIDSQESMLILKEIDPEDLPVYNGQVRYYKEVQELYSEFMEELTKELDLMEKESIDERKI